MSDSSEWTERSISSRSEIGEPEYYQVAQTTLDEGVLQRELAPLKKIHDNYPKYLLTLDEIFGEMNYSGIQKEKRPEMAVGITGLQTAHTERKKRRYAQWTRTKNVYRKSTTSTSKKSRRPITCGGIWRRHLSRGRHLHDRAVHLKHLPELRHG